MEPATDSRPGSGLVADTDDGRDWSRLPVDLLVSVVGAVRVADAIRSGAVCASWAPGTRRTPRSVCCASRRRGSPPACSTLPTPSPALAAPRSTAQPPPTGATLRIPFPRAPLAPRPFLGSGHGWLVTADDASDLHLLNPVTGDQVALPPITALHHVERGTDEQGDPAYLVYENKRHYNYSKNRSEIFTEPTILEVDQAHNYMYYRVVISASPSSAGRACVVLLLHMPYGEISFARIGDERWTWVTPSGGGGGNGLPWKETATSTLCTVTPMAWSMCLLDLTPRSMYSLDLHGPSPVVSKVLAGLSRTVDSKVISGMTRLVGQTIYLVQTPAGDILQVWRERDYVDMLTPPVVLPPDYVDDGDRHVSRPVHEVGHNWRAALQG